MVTPANDRVLKTLYYDPQEPSSYSSPQRLYDAARDKGLDLSLSTIRGWLRGQETYTLHRQVRRLYPRQKTRAYGIDEVWQSDLANCLNIKEENDGFGHILVTICILSKVGYATPIRDKTPKSMIEGFEVIFKGLTPPAYLHSDKGGEYLNKTVKRYLKEKGVYHYTSHSTEQKASCAERLIRTIKGRLYKYFTAKNTTRYIEVLPKIMHAYNHQYHRAIKMKPADVTLDHLEIIKQRLYGDEPRVRHVYKFEIGDKVRTTVAKTTFEKKYTRNFTHEIFTIHSRRYGDGLPLYRLTEYDGDLIAGTYYEPELQRIEKLDDVYKIERIVKSRGKGRRTEYLVKYMGYPSKYNEWIPKNRLQDV